MDKEVLITLKGLQINEPVDTGVVEIVALGEYYEKNDKKYIIYEEVVEGMEGKIKNIIKLSPTCMEVTKKGLTNTHMVFEENKKNLREIKDQMEIVRRKVNHMRQMRENYK